jgi:DsbC/DsbD-like thiol-disulfide interchange protein
MNRKMIRTVIMTTAVLAAGFLVNVNAQSVTGSIAGGSVTRGKATKATVVLSMTGGLHVNSNRPTGEYAIPTTVRASARGVRVGRVSYPRGHNRKFAFSESPINVYEGRVPFSFDLTVPETYKGNSVAVRVTVNYQACTNEVCYPPKSKEITLRASVH